MTTMTIRNELGRALRKFILEMESLRWSPHTRRAYEHAAKLFCRWLVRETAIATMNEITPETIRSYRLHLVRSKIAPSTQTLRLAAVKTFFRLMAKVGVVERDPASAIDLPRKRAMPVRRAVHLTRDDVERMIATIADDGSPFALRDRAILEVLYATGIRAGELCDLELSDFDGEEQTIFVRFGKCTKSRMLPLGSVATAALTRWIDEGRPQLVAEQSNEQHIFLGRLPGAMTRQSVARVVREAARRAGITGQVAPHRLRHACASHMLAGGAQLAHVQRMLGHTSIETTLRYTHVGIGDLADVHRRSHPRGGEETSRA